MCVYVCVAGGEGGLFKRPRTQFKTGGTGAQSGDVSSDLKARQDVNQSDNLFTRLCICIPGTLRELRYHITTNCLRHNHSYQIHTRLCVNCIYTSVDQLS